MIINDSVLQNSEKIIFSLRELFTRCGYSPYRMSKFEEYDLYADNKDFLVSDNIITFTDVGGKLMALKPDVTLSIIKNSKDEPENTKKVYYNENVYRAAKDLGSFKEIMQVGAECFGKVGEKEEFEVISMAAESLKLLSSDCVLALSNLDVIKSVVSGINLTPSEESRLFAALGEKNAHEIDAVCPDEKRASALKKLISVCGSIDSVLKDYESIVNGSFADKESCESFKNLLETLKKSEFCDIIKVDFSVTDDINYYNGTVFKGYIKNIPGVVLSGGQYDNLMKKMKRKSSAIGFAVYTDMLEYTDSDKSADDGYINVALPKGRLGEKIYSMFESAGFDCPAILEQNRKLVFENEKKKLRFFWVKPSDVAIYVERGSADIGVAGKDVILEYEPDVYELLDLKKGVCRMTVAAPESFKDDASKTLRVATKFSKIAQKYYQSKGRDIDIIHLNGSIEIAPILGLSDVIVDIVETGTTLRENNLKVFEEIFPISARLIANKSSYKFKTKQIENIVSGLSEITEEAK
ncbi:MAG: ATP phosphoribosyltransferase [Clostridia bacterium]|nr:ATP phosphoribosyltransferase [Clostridia bacterium]